MLALNILGIGRSTQDYIVTRFSLLHDTSTSNLNLDVITVIYYPSISAVLPIMDYVISPDNARFYINELTLTPDMIHREEESMPQAYLDQLRVNNVGLTCSIVTFSFIDSRPLLDIPPGTPLNCTLALRILVGAEWNTLRILPLSPGPADIGAITGTDVPDPSDGTTIIDENDNNVDPYHFPYTCISVTANSTGFLFLTPPVTAQVEPFFLEGFENYTDLGPVNGMEVPETVLPVNCSAGATVIMALPNGDRIQVTSTTDCFQGVGDLPGSVDSNPENGKSITYTLIKTC
jgi:hypothetical protein